ncbi:MFS transporter [Streptomyces acidiscabies]|uniref:MFS transporter n=1 Tax=Streptomyces acidiscabies TaxID=42234 RepID=A0AAP6EE30_9ACTN|nr:MFS transporter [Streptomyces acidiscabies]MDX2959418.1 MFS transporter [Streptomyces acidiscabies]MDX3019294.1 MFS transporter [Streptomyces acidiscabies]MDX3790625.1 MFS transporter [Streptomyces acidiscabies]
MPHVHQKPPRTHRTPGPYRRLLSHPGASAFTAGNLVARLPSGMFSVSAVMMIADAHGSYALAGAVSATGLAATAVAAPWVARLVDRRGQAQVAVPAALFAALGSIALVLCVRYDAPVWTLFAAYAATATTPNTGGMSRARWAHLLAGDEEALHTANSFEQAADELCFLLGPLIAALLCANVFPEAGTLTAAALLVTGILLFAAQRRTEPPPHAHPSAKSPLTSPGMPPLLAACLCLGAVFGATEVVTVAFADEAGHRAAAGLVLGLQAGGSALAGLVFGAMTGHGEGASGKGRRTSKTGAGPGQDRRTPKAGADTGKGRQAPKTRAAPGKGRRTLNTGAASGEGHPPLRAEPTPRKEHPAEPTPDKEHPAEPTPGKEHPVANMQTSKTDPPPNSTPAARRYPCCIAAMATLLTLPLLAATLTGSLPLLALALLVSGAATAPTMITGMTLVQQRTPEGRLNEGMTLAVTGLLGGIATGSALGGWVADHTSPTTGYGIPVAAACAALLVTLTWRARNTGHAEPTTAPNTRPNATP